MTTLAWIVLFSFAQTAVAAFGAGTALSGNVELRWVRLAWAAGVVFVVSSLLLAVGALGVRVVVG